MKRPTSSATVWVRLAACVFACAISIRPASAQIATSEPLVAEKAGKELRALRITGSSPRVDGRLDDEIWTAADTIDDLVQDEPDNLQTPTDRTVIQVAYDDRYIYIAARCYVTDASGIRMGLGRRDNFPPSDVIAISFDPRHDHLTSYTFRANPSGVQADMMFVDDTRANDDYDGVWEVGTDVTPEGWIAEFQIPFSQMRFDVPPGNAAVWGFQIRRDIQRLGEIDRWVGTPRGVQGFVSRFGHLIFADRLTPPRRLEILPFVLGQVEQTADAGSSQAVNAGLDIRVGIGPSATLSATVNPDFGQIEADPAVLNLSVFETFFPEKRPFFLEDSRTFVLQYTQFPDFYSRRIGQRPNHFALADTDELVKKPDTTTIIGAAKLTGKGSGWTYGALTALTDREYATVDRTATDSTGNEVVFRTEQLVEPLTQYSVGRLQRDILDGTSTIGVLATSVVREGDQGSFTVGGDYNIRWGANRYIWNGHWVGTHAPIDEVMRNGIGGSANFSYNGKYLRLSGHYDHFDLTFRNTDIGFLSSRRNKNEASGNINVGQPDPWRIFRSVNANVYWGRQWNAEQLTFGKWIGSSANLTFRNFWSVYFGGQRNFERLDDLDTRGGPPILQPASTFFNAGFGSDSRKRWGLSLNLSGEQDTVDGWNMSVGPSLRLQPSGRLQASINASYTRARDSAQWIENSDVDADGTDDHVYGTLRRNVLNITGRATYGFTRDLTVEAFLQPFVAVGDYADIRKLARPSSYDFTPAALSDDPDFSNKSLRGTVVMRWEYVRGSTLFLVWNRSTSDTTRPGDFSAFRDLGTAFSASGTNVLAVKVNFWWTP